MTVIYSRDQRSIHGLVTREYINVVLYELSCFHNSLSIEVSIQDNMEKQHSKMENYCRIKRVDPFISMSVFGSADNGN